MKETGAAQRAIDEEMARIVDAGAIDPKKLLSWKRDVAGKIPGARKVKGMLVMVEKNIESQQFRGWKARFVAVGCRILDQFERRVVEDLQHIFPSSLDMIRLSMVFECMVGSNGVTLQGDVKGRRETPS